MGAGGTAFVAPKSLLPISVSSVIWFRATLGRTSVR
jgi:hypothetical protein